MRKFQFQLSILTLFILAACGNVPVTSLPALNAIDMRTSDLNQLSAVAKIPDAIDISKLKLTYKVTVSSKGQSKSGSALLEKTQGDAQTQALIAKEQKPGYQFVAYRLNPKDIPALEELRAQGEAWKQQNGIARGDIGILFNDVCVPSDIDETQKLKASVWIRTEETQKYTLLFKNLNISPNQLNAEPEVIEEYYCSN